MLVLGGTAEARELAAALDGAGVRVISSLAGRVADPRLPAGEVRVGGFGGPDALADWLREHAVRAVVDATHPFAERISASAARACPQAGVPLLRLERPGWTPRPGDDWHRVTDLHEAAALAPPLPRRHELLLGRGPFTLAGELGLMDAHRIDLIITKDSGGPLTEAKLDAAREREAPVIVVDRPPRPDVETVPTVAEAFAWAQATGYVRGV